MYSLEAAQNEVEAVDNCLLEGLQLTLDKKTEAKLFCDRPVVHKDMIEPYIVALNSFRKMARMYVANKLEESIDSTNVMLDMDAITE
jgi:hypothetical protein